MSRTYACKVANNFESKVLLVCAQRALAWSAWVSTCLKVVPTKVKGKLPQAEIDCKVLQSREGNL